MSTVSDIALIVIPEEAEDLIALVSEAQNPPTHLLAYAAPVTRKMLHFNDLKYYSVPSLPKDWKAPMWLRVELGIFAGHLYFDYMEYSYLLQYLGVKEDASKIEEEETEDLVEQRQELTTFTRKPLTFLQEWLAICRKGQDFAQTPIGFVCQGKPLAESHPFFTRPENDGEIRKAVHIKRLGAAGTSEEEDEVEQDFCDDAYGFDVGVDTKDEFDDSQLKDEQGDQSSESDD